MTHTRALVLLSVFIAAAFQLGCSGGGSAAQSTGSSINTANSTPPPPLLRITTTSLPNTIQGQTYSQMLQASGGTPPYVWSTSGNSPCPGFSLTASGLLSGTPAYSGNQSCYVVVTDSSRPPQIDSRVLIFHVSPILSIAAPTPSSPPAVRHSFSELFWANGGFGGYTWSLQSGSLPPGLTLASGSLDVMISGTPTVRGTYNFTLQLTDTGPPQQMATQAVSLTVLDYPEITTNFLPVGLVNYPYNTQLQVIGGTPPYTFGMNASSLPSGMTLDPATGILSGRPTTIGNQYVSFTVTDSQAPPLQSTASFFLTINPVLQFTQSQSALSDAVQGRPYTYALPFQGGLPPYTIAITSGALPAGISVPASSTVPGTFDGSPTLTGSSNFTLSVQDAESPPVGIQQAFSIRVNPPLVITTTQAPPGVVGIPYSFQFQATGGVPPYSWGDNAIDGLSMDPSTGLLSGTPMTANSLYLYVTVADSSNPHQSAIVSFPVPIYDRLKIISSLIPPIAPNSLVDMQLSGFGGTGNYIWSLASGILPNGLNLSPGGQFLGRPTQTGSFPVTLQLGDAGPPAQTANLSTTITISSALGRNDSPSTATPLSNGTYQASISPFSDPPTGVANPDSDYYVLTANPGATVTIEIKAQRLTPPSPLDSVLELVDANNNRLSLCEDPLYYPFGSSYTSPCLNDDIPNAGTTDSILILQVPGTNAAPLTFYAHVLDWRGDARPDFIYTITITGTN